MAVGTLLLWMPVLERLLFPWESGMTRRERVSRGVVGAFVVGLVAQAGSWPLIAYHYNTFSVIAPLANPPIVLLAGGLLLAGLAAVCLASLPLVPDLVFSLLEPLLGLLRLCALGFGALPWAAISVVSPPLIFIASYYALLWGVAPFLSRHVLQKTLFAPPPAPPASGGLVGVAATR